MTGARATRRQRERDDGTPARLDREYQRQQRRGSVHQQSCWQERCNSTSGWNWAEFMAMALVTMTPIVVLYLSASKQIYLGVTLSGVKG